MSGGWCQAMGGGGWGWCADHCKYKKNSREMEENILAAQLQAGNEEGRPSGGKCVEKVRTVPTIFLL